MPGQEKQKRPGHSRQEVSPDRQPAPEIGTDLLMNTVHNASRDAQIHALQNMGIFTVNDLGRYADNHGIRPTEVLEAAAGQGE